MQKISFFSNEFKFYAAIWNNYRIIESIIYYEMIESILFLQRILQVQWEK